MQLRIGILGMTPQDISDLRAADRIRERLPQREKLQSVMEWETDLRM